MNNFHLQWKSKRAQYKPFAFGPKTKKILKNFQHILRFFWLKSQWNSDFFKISRYIFLRFLPLSRPTFLQFFRFQGAFQLSFHPYATEFPFVFMRSLTKLMAIVHKFAIYTRISARLEFLRSLLMWIRKQERVPESTFALNIFSRNLGAIQSQSKLNIYIK